MDKRPSAKVEEAIWGYIDPYDPIPGSWKEKVFIALFEHEDKYGIISTSLVYLFRQVIDEMALKKFGMSLYDEDFLSKFPEFAQQIQEIDRMENIPKTTQQLLQELYDQISDIGRLVVDALKLQRIFNWLAEVIEWISRKI